MRWSGVTYPVCMGREAAASRVLVIGLDPHRVPGPWDPEPVAEAIARGMDDLARHGFDAESCLIGLDGSDDPELRVTAALQSGEWACVVIGGGIRTSEELRGLFESIINLVPRHAPGASMVFNTAPDDLRSAVERRLRPKG